MRERKQISKRKIETDTKKQEITVYEAECWCCQTDYKEKQSPKECKYCRERLSRSMRNRNDYSEVPLTICKECSGTGKKRRVSKTTEQKFLCIGGPKNEQMLTEQDAGKDYYPFNRATGGWHSRQRNEPAPPKVVLIHKASVIIK